MKRKLVLVGGGGHCQSVLDTLDRQQQYEDIVVVDRAYPEMKTVLGYPVAGNDDVLGQLRQDGFSDAFISVGSIRSTASRERLFRILYQLGYRIPNIIDPSAQISQHAVFGEGVFVGKGVMINASVYVGSMAIINTGAIVEHTCIIGDYTHVSVGAKLCGNVSVGSHSLVGAGATVVQGVSVGSHTIIGAGSTVIRNVGDNLVVKGLVK